MLDYLFLKSRLKYFLGVLRVFARDAFKFLLFDSGLSGLGFAESRDKIPCTVYDGKDFYVFGIPGNSIDDSVVVKDELSQPEIFQLRHNPAQARHGTQGRDRFDE
jgi:hypothetical protein